MNKPCYCCDNPRIDAGTKENINLDRALDELGTLNVTKKSRKELKRQVQYTSEDRIKSLQGGFCVFHMDKNFVTNLVTNSSFSQWIGGDTAQGDDDSRLKIGQKTNFVLKNNKSKKIRQIKPYELPWNHKLYQDRSRTVSWNHPETDNCVDDTTCSSTSSSSSAGNRSNPSSPSKCGQRNGLVRSRSLDHLNCPVWDNDDTTHAQQPLVQCREEIENVSRQMRHLTVT